MIDLGKATGNQVTEALGHYHLGGVQMDQNKLQAALDSYRINLELLPEKKDSETQKLRIFSLDHVARVYIQQGKLKDALSLLQDIRGQLESMGEQHGLATCQLDIGMAYYYQGRYDDAHEWIDAAIRLFREIGNQLGLLKAMNNLCGIYFARGDMSAGEALAQKALKIAETVGDIQSVAAIQGNLAVCYLEKGDYRESAVSIRDALDRYRECDFQTGVNISMINRGQILIEQGEFDTAEKVLSNAIERTEDSGEPWLTVYARLYLADMLANRGQWKDACDQLDLCEKISREIGVRPLEIQATSARVSLLGRSIIDVNS